MSIQKLANGLFIISQYEEDIILDLDIQLHEVAVKINGDRNLKKSDQRKLLDLGWVFYNKHSYYGKVWIYC